MLFIMGKLKMVLKMAGVLSNIGVKIFTKGNGKMIINTDMEYANSTLHQFIKEIIKMECHKVMDCLYGEMDQGMKDLGIED